MKIQFLPWTCRKEIEITDLQGANLQGANLQGADLQGADLWGANLQGANLWSVNLWNAKINWQSHDLVFEILRKSAKEPIEFMVAGFVIAKREWCWKDFHNTDFPGKLWAISILKPLGAPIP